MITEITITTQKSGLYEITDKVEAVVNKSKTSEGLCTVFVRHTSASLIIQENADPSAREDLERWLDRMVPEGDPLYSHTSEGQDDMPAHIKAALTNPSISIPFSNNRLLIGTWQGIYLWEHRHRRQQRSIIVQTCGS